VRERELAERKKLQRERGGADVLRSRERESLQRERGCREREVERTC
jgi:DeoR/GlpR family transcriptional regulator of sugar metabolism